MMFTCAVACACAVAPRDSGPVMCACAVALKIAYNPRASFGFRRMRALERIAHAISVGDRNTRYRPRADDGRAVATCFHKSPVKATMNGDVPPLYDINKKL